MLMPEFRVDDILQGFLDVLDQLRVLVGGRSRRTAGSAELHELGAPRSAAPRRPGPGRRR